MCGRYTIDENNEDILEQLKEIQRKNPSAAIKTGEIYPTNVAPVLIPEGNKITPDLLVWGFPNFKNKGVIINARAETADEKRMFKSCLKSKRCVIPTTGFYEWDKEKNKVKFNLPDTEVLYLAGLYNEFNGEKRYVILTTEANSSVVDVHNRMPVVVAKDEIDNWIYDINQVNYILFNEHPSLTHLDV